MDGTYVIKLLVSDGTNAVEAEIEINVATLVSLSLDPG